MRLFQQAVGVLLVVLLAGCGTIIGGSSQAIQVNSNPAQALVTSDPVTKDYTTPATIRLERKQYYTLTFTKDGYSKEEVLVERGMRGGVLVADILLFPIGIIVDAITGAWYGLSPDSVSVTLVKQNAEVEGPERIEVSLSGTQGAEIHVDASVPVEVSLETGN